MEIIGAQEVAHIKDLAQVVKEDTLKVRGEILPVFKIEQQLSSTNIRIGFLIAP